MPFVLTESTRYFELRVFRAGTMHDEQTVRQTSLSPE
jgi:hypothetical protein